MRALVYHRRFHLALEDRPEPARPRGEEVLLRIRATGICGTDLGIAGGVYDASPGVILGHESAGEVIAVGGEVRRLREGDRVVLDPTYACGCCRLCRSGRSNHCEVKGQTETGVSRDGTFTPYHLTTERFLYKLPDHVGFAGASLTEPLSCAVTGAAQLRAHPALRTVVLGGGPMGLLYTHALGARGLRGALVEAAAERREIARGLCPSGWTCAASLDEARGAFPGEESPLDIVVDTTGVLAGEALPLLARGGQLLLVGLRPARVTLDQGRIADRSLSILGSIDSLDNSFAAALHLIASGAVPAERMVTRRLGLDRYAEGFALLGCDLEAGRSGPPGAAVKVVLEP